ncbi:MAG: hypothetical protein JWN08_2172 [Frankiales bacterium]|nr:hypothetical protein [Frankiales bacterium]
MFLRVGPQRAARGRRRTPLVKRLVLAAAVLTALGSAVGSASAEPSLCLTTDVSINGTALPTNGTQCLPPAAE